MEPVEEALGIPSSGYEYMKVSSEHSDLERLIYKSSINEATLFVG